MIRYMNGCSICLKDTIPISVQCVNNCGHVYCKPCIDSWLDKGKNTCPMCRQEIKYMDHNSDKYRIVLIDKKTENRVTNHDPRYIYIRKDLFKIIRGGFLLMTFTLIGQITYIFHRYRSHGEIISQYNYCIDYYKDPDNSHILNCIYDDKNNGYIPCPSMETCLNNT